MSEYVFRYASGYGCNMSALMDGGRVTVGEYFASDAADHYGTLHEEIVRCMDCTWFANDAMHGAWCKNLGVSLHDDYDGFCAWGTKVDE